LELNSKSTCPTVAHRENDSAKPLISVSGTALKEAHAFRQAGRPVTSVATHQIHFLVFHFCEAHPPECEKWKWKRQELKTIYARVNTRVVLMGLNHKPRKKQSTGVNYPHPHPTKIDVGIEQCIILSKSRATWQ
jgi:hypothetical protein